MVTDVTRAEFDLELVVSAEGGDITFECVNHNSTWALNRIPMASCVVAVGRNVRTLEAATIHAKAQNLTKMLPAKVILRPKGQWAASQKIDGDDAGNGLWTKAGEQVIFDGYVTGLGFFKQRGAFRVSIQLIHWLSDLAFSSMFSEQSHPGNPSNATGLAAWKGAIAGANAGKKPAMLSTTRFYNHMIAANIRQDFWGKALAPMLCDIAAQDLIPVGPPEACGGKNAKNDFALKALARIQGNGHPCEKLPEGATNRHVPLTLTALGGLSTELADAITEHTGRKSLEAAWAMTIWDTLVNDLAPTYMFNIVPLVQTALVTPFVPGLREAWKAKVPASDVARLSINSYIRRPLRGVGIFAGKSANTTINDNSEFNIAGLMGLGGCFLPDEEAEGMIMIKRAPAWLSGISDMPVKPGKSALGREGDGGAPKVTGGALTPDANKPQQGKKKAEAAVESEPLFSQLAQYLYMVEILRGRNGTMSGKFRMDIAPGSTIFVENFGDQNIQQDLLSTDFYASVIRVSLGLDAENARAGTAFQLAHIRNEAENGDDRTSIADHPIYEGQKFSGAPLVDAYLFD